MRPTYYDLLSLNPLLGNRTPAEVEALLNTIEECGYTWDPSQQQFIHPEISRAIRTQGLDMFTPQRFKEMHKRFYQEYAADPERYNLHAQGMIIWQKRTPRLIILFILDLLFGWIFLSVKWWLISLACIVSLFFFIKNFFVDSTRPK